MKSFGRELQKIMNVSFFFYCLELYLQCRCKWKRNREDEETKYMRNKI